MSTLPRGRCRSCHQLVPIRVNGAAREHRIPVNGVRLEAHTREVTAIRTSMVCPGAGLAVVGRRSREAFPAVTAIHVSVTAEDIAAGARPDADAAHNRFWAAPVEGALARLTGENVDVDGGDGTVYIATIGQGAWTVVVDLPAEANRFLNARWYGEGDGEPFEFDLVVDGWLVDLVRDEQPLLTLREAAARLGVKPATLRQQAQGERNGFEGPSPRARRLRARKLGRDWFVDRVAVEREAQLRELVQAFDALPRPPWPAEHACMDTRCGHPKVDHASPLVEDGRCLRRPEGCQCGGWDPLTAEQWRIVIEAERAGLVPL